MTLPTIPIWKFATPTDTYEHMILNWRQNAFGMFNSTGYYSEINHTSAIKINHHIPNLELFEQYMNTHTKESMQDTLEKIKRIAEARRQTYLDSLLNETDDQKRTRLINTLTNNHKL